MAFIDRVVDYPGRITLTDTGGVELGTYDVARAEGNVYTAGTLLNAANLNQQTQLDAAVQTKYSALETDTSYQNDMSNALNYIVEVLNTQGRLIALSSSLTLTTSAQKVPINSFTGTGCSKSNNGIKVNTAGYYLISGSIYCSTGYTANDLIHLMIRVNSTDQCEAIFRVGVANYYSTLHAGPCIIHLDANDVVYLYAYNQGGNRGTVESRTGNGLMVNRIA